ncbi:hypothetical protein EJ08DRAFT_673710 [Tothia fuscella]|uniref:Type I phosphodiesterase/nucleotide pyrophosphatase n=1 Tax=Tothia fuscella TaxID=1048955 RepID=A0A9P4NE74_9PEZI|nr:hypothetical protein EJ08DRAFT_673710 [Tothia fuscella]
MPNTSVKDTEEPALSWGKSNWNSEDNICRDVSSKYVTIFSIDGLHSSDLDKYLALGPSNFSKLLDTGYRYTNAFTSFPSDSFPGTLAPFTGATPKTHGVWYDDPMDDLVIVVYDESIDIDEDLLLGGGIDPKKLPKAIINGTCTPVYPHMRPRVNIVFEIVVRSGMKTAYTIKHPAYDFLRGPFGTGLTAGYFPELNNADSPADNVDKTIVYDTLHVNAFLGWIDGKDPANAAGSLKGEIPALFGGNSTVSVGRKTKGYGAKTLDFSPDLLKAITFVDTSLGAMVNKLKSEGIYEDTLIMVVLKHDQSPIDLTELTKVDPATFKANLGVKSSYITFDDLGLIFLDNPKDLDAAVKNLNIHEADLKIEDIIFGDRQINLGLGDVRKAPAVPNIIVQQVLGAIYTTSKSKVAEHGG